MATRLIHRFQCDKTIVLSSVAFGSFIDQIFDIGFLRRPREYRLEEIDSGGDHHKSFVYNL